MYTSSGNQQPAASKRTCVSRQIDIYLIVSKHLFNKDPVYSIKIDLSQMAHLGSATHPTANAIAERSWRTLVDLARTNMAAEAKLSEYINSDFWPYAIEYSTLIMNLVNQGL